jgi:hypothetical protein
VLSEAPTYSYGPSSNQTQTDRTTVETILARDRDRIKPGYSITTIARRDQPSAWARGALYGGGLTLIAQTLAFGWTTLRPGPRRRQPELPAPAVLRHRRRGRGCGSFADRPSRWPEGARDVLASR